MSNLNKSFRLFHCAFNNSKLFNVKKYPNFDNMSRNLSISHKLFAVIPFNLSDIGEGIREVVVKEWYVKVGDKVAQFDNICEVQSDKASVTITSRYDGIISKLYHRVDDIALVGKPLIDVETDDKESPVESKDIICRKNNSNIIGNIELKITNDEPQNYIAGKEDSMLCIPSVRRLAKEYKINLSQVTGTGKNGRILKENIIQFLKTTQPEAPAAKPLEDRIEPIKGFRKAMVKTMTESLKIPHFVYSDEIKVTKLSQLRKYLKTLPELKDLKITLMPFFIKALSNALQRYPAINATVDETCEHIFYKEHHNIGIAMDTKVGLAVPVIKNIEQLNIIEIATELNRLIESGRNGTFSPNDLSGGTFTISNIGNIGGTYLKPVILPPQVAIIALGASQLLPRFDTCNNVVPEEILTISGAADHRVIDGATMAMFTKIVKRQIENPNMLFLNL